MCWLQAAAAAEAERVIRSFLSGIAVQICQAAVDWAMKVMSPLSDSSSIDDMSKEAAIAVGGKRPSILSELLPPAQLFPPPSVAPSRSTTPLPGTTAASVSTPGNTNSPGPLPQEPHPDVVVAQIVELAAPLRVVDKMFRQAGNHSALDEVDSGVKDVLSTVSAWVWIWWGHPVPPHEARSALLAMTGSVY
jgi:hypothetical protein